MLCNRRPAILASAGRPAEAHKPVAIKLERSKSVGSGLDLLERASAGRAVRDATVGVAREAGHALALFRTLNLAAMVGDMQPTVMKLLAKLDFTDLLLSPNQDPNDALSANRIETYIRSKAMWKVTIATARKAPGGAQLTAGGMFALGLAVPAGKIGAIAGGSALLGIGLAATPYWTIKNRQKARAELDRCFRLPEVRHLVQMKHEQFLAKLTQYHGNLEEALRAGVFERMRRTLQASAWTVRTLGVAKYTVTLLGAFALLFASAFSLMSGLTQAWQKHGERRKMLRDPAGTLAAALASHPIDKRRYFVAGRTAFQRFVKAHKAEVSRLLGLPEGSSTRVVLKALERPHRERFRQGLRETCRHGLLRSELDAAAEEAGTSLEAALSDHAELFQLVERYAIKKAAGLAGRQVLGDALICSLKLGVLVAASAALAPHPGGLICLGTGVGIFLIGALIAPSFSKRERRLFNEKLSAAAARAHEAMEQGKPVDAATQREAREIFDVIRKKMGRLLAPEPSVAALFEAADAEARAERAVAPRRSRSSPALGHMDESASARPSG